MIIGNTARFLLHLFLLQGLYLPAGLALVRVKLVVAGLFKLARWVELNGFVGEKLNAAYENRILTQDKGPGEVYYRLYICKPTRSGFTTCHFNRPAGWPLFLRFPGSYCGITNQQ
jgi:hypothetical protein